jgi:hypothetical protein
VPADYSIFTLLGILFIVLGVMALLLPYLLQANLLRRLEELPPILVYVYHRDGFYFATSPLLIVVSVVYFLYRWLTGSTA